MADNMRHGARSTAAIAGHPIHPMLVPFPIAFLVGALASDLVFIGTRDGFWARGSLWLIAAGLVMGAFAAIAGLTDFLTIERARSPTGWVHFLGNAVALVAALVSLVLRIGDPAAAILPAGLILSCITVAIFLVTGWLGGELAYRFKIGVIEEEASEEPRAVAEAAYASDKPRAEP